MTQTELEAKSYKELKQIAKEKGIKPLQTKVILIEEILKLEPLEPLEPVEPVIDEETFDFADSVTDEDIENSLEEEILENLDSILDYPSFKNLIEVSILSKCLYQVDTMELYHEYMATDLYVNENQIVNWAIKKILK